MIIYTADLSIEQGGFIRTETQKEDGIEKVVKIVYTNEEEDFDKARNNEMAFGEIMRNTFKKSKYKNMCKIGDGTSLCFISSDIEFLRLMIVYKLKSTKIESRDEIKNKCLETMNIFISTFKNAFPDFISPDTIFKVSPELKEFNFKDNTSGLLSFNAATIKSEFWYDPPKFSRYLYDIDDCDISKMRMYPLMDNIKDEFKKIESSKFDRYFGVPSWYVIPSLGSETIINALTAKMYDANMLLSKLIAFKDVFSRRDSFFEIDNTYEIKYVNGPGMTYCIYVPDIDNKTAGIQTKNSTTISTDRMDEFLDRMKEVFVSNVNIFFITEDKYTIDYITEGIASRGFRCRDLNPSVTDNILKIKKMLNKWAKEDGLGRFTGNNLLEAKTFRADEILAIFKTWKSNTLTAMIDGKRKKEAKKPKIVKPVGKLKAMIGLPNVKTTIKEIVDHFKMQEILKKRGVSQLNPCKHMMFYGEPGTAKTTVARLVGEILKDNGILPTGKFVEVSRQDLVGEYVGQTAVKTTKVINKARGGILFIDEAYSLVDDRRGLFGDEAINTLVQQMDIIKDDTIIIFAGYPGKLDKLMNVNDGFRSRIAFHVKFDKYTVDDLIEILKKMADDKQYILTEDAIARAREVIEDHIDDEDFGNGRFVRNILERSAMKLSSRQMKEVEDLSTVDTKLLTTIHPDDIEDIKQLNKDELERKVGFNFNTKERA